MRNDSDGRVLLRVVNTPAPMGLKVSMDVVMNLVPEVLEEEVDAAAGDDEAGRSGVG